VVNPFSALASVLSNSGSQAGVATFFGLLAGWGPSIIQGDPAQLQSLRPLWHYTLAFDLVLSTGLYLLATRFVKPVQPWRIGWRGASLVILIAGLYLILGTTIFFNDIRQTIYPTATPIEEPADE
jgi:hypothetical protein